MSSNPNASLRRPVQETRQHSRNIYMNTEKQRGLVPEGSVSALQMALYGQQTMLTSQGRVVRLFGFITCPLSPTFHYKNIYMMDKKLRQEERKWCLELDF
ncbi:hypothetical protein EPI10_025630 [Gossypium australe]|uniref:Uncharacterized protein n=1 Tax=Gossypium australe TaxID=47621 RepID=A0A5B6W1J9_9ROSI|nr:hypothetical protein EPI10_025630 [Gossypium australe]